MKIENSMSRRYLMLLVAIVAGFTSTIQAKKEKNLDAKTMYFVGTAKSYQDSIVYMTDIMLLENVAIDKATGGVANIEMYSDQLKKYLAQMGKTGYICSIFYEKSQKKIEKTYMKLKKRVMKDKSAQFAPLSFRYEYVDPSSIYRNSIEEKAAEEAPKSEQE